MTVISKSKYLVGRQCPLLLWTHYNDPRAIPEPDAATRAVFDVGHEIGALAQRCRTGGEEVPHSRDLDATVARTRELMALRRPVYEASFLVDGRYCRVDILDPADDGAWDLIEVKSGTVVKDVNLDDVAFQADTLRLAGVELRDLYLMHVERDYVRRGAVDPRGLFRTENVTGICRDRAACIAMDLGRMREVVEGEKPAAVLGPHCDIPYACPLREKCWKKLPDHDVTTFYRIGRKAYRHIDNGLLAVADVPDVVLSDIQRIQKAAVVSGEAHVDRPGVADWVGRLEYPLWLLDFETMSPAVPLFDGTRPYQRIPFQFSLHVIEEPGAEPVHHEFLAETSDDPRPALLEALEVIGSAGNVMAYNMSFEKGVLKELGTDFPEHAALTGDLRSRMVDLMDPFRAFDIYHPEQRGSCSIKAVLPAFTDLSYRDMEIADGNAASREYMRAVHGDADEDRRRRTLAALRRYCGLDTLAMVELLKVVERLSR